MKSTTDTLIDTKSVLYIGLDKKWEVNEMINLYSSIQNQYDFYSILNIINQYNFNNKVWDKVIIKAIGYLLQNFLGENTTIFNNSHQVYYFNRSKSKLHKIDLGEPLLISRIEFSSPGSLELLGMKDILSIIKDTIFKSIEIYQNRGCVKQEVKRQELQDKILALDVMNKYIELMNSVGIEEEQIKEIVLKQVINLEAINGLMTQGKIKAVK
jgi:hypothetical protein